MVSYFSDFEGNNIINSGKNSLNPSEQTNSIVSDYLGYGSFSGSDIKVVVHYPYSRAMELALLQERTKLEQRHSVLGYMTNFEGTNRQEVGQKPLPVSYLSDFEENTPLSSVLNFDELQSIQIKMDFLDEELKAVQDMPTSKVLGEIQTISWSIFREKAPVRTLGSVYPRAYVRGPRTIGGSMVFTIFHQHVLHEILALNLGMFSTGTSDHDNFRYSTNLADQIPPIDISLIFANEYGAISHMGLWGVEFVQEGGTFSTEDIFSESQMQYVARDLDPMRLVNTRKTDGQGVTIASTKTASNLLYEQHDLNRHLTRRDPFI